jgi:hypothetical protein
MSIAALILVARIEPLKRIDGCKVAFEAIGKPNRAVRKAGVFNRLTKEATRSDLMERGSRNKVFVSKSIRGGHA